MSNSVPTLFDKYGGVPAVRSLVREFHQRFAASPTLRRHFDNVSAEKFIQHHVELIAYTLGRPAASFDPHKMSEQNHPHDISLSSFDKVVDILRQVLLDASVEGRDIAQILHRLHQQRHRIVPNVLPLNDIYIPEHVDELSGLGNREALRVALAEACAKYHQEQRPVALALMRAAPSGRESLPTDRLGIEMLERHLAGALSRTARRADTLCRREDGVFALVLNATDPIKASAAAQRIHSAVKRELFTTAHGKQRIELAIGLASCGSSFSSSDDLIEAAERALGLAGQSRRMIVEA
jgi:hemoglobin